jgi:serine/threonine protein kinase
MLAHKYKLLAKLNQGSFGQIYKAENIRTGELVAVKIEPKTGDQKSLKSEAKIYQYLAKLDGFPQLKWYGSTDKFIYLVTDLLDHSISDLVKRQGRLEMQIVLLLGKQMIQRLYILHNHFLLHRDIKPQNFMLDVSTNKLYLIDFGFCKRYNYDGEHIEKGTISNMIGTPNFVSINVHKGVEPSRRDDIESCIYIMIYMLFGKLIWEKEIDSKKMCFKKEQLTNTEKPLIPDFLKQMLIYVRALDFDECPDYVEIIKVFDTVYAEMGFPSVAESATESATKKSLEVASLEVASLEVDEEEDEISDLD